MVFAAQEQSMVARMGGLNPPVGRMFRHARIAAAKGDRIAADRFA
tara:strand:- start:162 stop:296 length:135 start_codon:yes stop_codon:yes gene_type:complete